MSQYPSPYSTPYPIAYPYDPAAALLAPARRASILMFILGGLGVVCGLCVGTFALIGPVDQIINKMKLPSAAELQMPPEQLVKIVFATMAILALVQAIGTIILAVFVRRGAMVAIVISIVFCVLILLFFLLSSVAALVQLAGGVQIEWSRILFTVVALAMYGLLFAWLIQAARAATAARAMRSQYQAQLWQAQQQQMQGQAGYAQQIPPPPPPPPAGG